MSKLINLFLFSSLIFSCHSMSEKRKEAETNEVDENIWEQHNGDMGKAFVESLRAPITLTFEQLIEIYKWQTEFPGKTDDAIGLFNKAVPPIMKNLLEKFANQKIGESFYKHFIFVDGVKSSDKSVFASTIAQQLNCSRVYIPIMSLIDPEDRNWYDAIVFLFKTAKQEKKPIFIILDDVDVLLKQLSDKENINSTFEELIKIIDKELDQSCVFVMLMAEKLDVHSDKFENYIVEIPSFPSDEQKPIASNKAESNKEVISDTRTNPFQQAKTLSELIEKMGWQTDCDMTDDQIEQSFESLDPDMQTVLNQFADPESRTEYPYRHGLILQGPPGTGKSTVTFAIAKHFKIFHVFLPATSLVDEWKNSGPGNIAHLMKLAKQEDCAIILSLDEIDALLKRNQLENNPDHGILDAFVQAIDSLKSSQVFVILTTNGLEGYPKKFLSRFNNYIFEMGIPSGNVREKIIESLMKKYRIDQKITDQKKLAELKKFLVNKSKSLDYREIEDLFQNGLRIAERNKTTKSKNDKNARTFAVPTEGDYARGHKMVISKRPFWVVQKLEKISTFCKNHTAALTFAFGILALCAGWYYYKGQQWLSLKQLKQGEDLTLKQMAQQKLIADLQMKQQERLANNQIMIQALKDEHITKKMNGWIRWLPIIGGYYTTRLQTIGAMEIVQKLQELNIAPELVEKMRNPDIAAQELVALKNEAAAILCGTTVGAPVSLLAAIAIGAKLGSAQGATIDATLLGTSLGAGTVAGSALGSLCGFAYWLLNKK